MKINFPTDQQIFLPRFQLDDHALRGFETNVERSAPPQLSSDVERAQADTLSRDPFSFGAIQLTDFRYDNMCT